MTRRRHSNLTRVVGALAALSLVTVLATVVGPVTPVAASVQRAITAGTEHTCVLLDYGTVKCWGRNTSGQLGLGDMVNRGDGAGEMGLDLPAVRLGTGRTATAISAGTKHTCALLDDGTVKCWGANTYGGLGLGDTATRGDGPGEMGDNLPTVNLGTGRTATAISAGSNYTCALLDDGSVKCWGRNASGQLGLGTIEEMGDEPGEMGDHLPAADLGTGRTATAISAGLTHTCALLDNGAVKCWGFNGYGQLGLGDTASRGDHAGEMGDNLPTVDLGTGRTATEVSVGDYRTCAVLDIGTVKCWGAGPHGQLGYGDTTSRGDQSNEMGDALPTVDLGTDRTATALGRRTNAHTCALLDNATVKCWGLNNSGQLGLGNNADRGDAPGEMGDNLLPVNLGSGGHATAIAVTSGNLHSCALLSDDSVKCWGENQYGQLGQGNTTDRGDGPGELGDSLPPVDLGFVVDTTDPTVGLATPADGARFSQNRVVGADYTCADEVGGSGIDTCDGTVPTGSPLDTSSQGDHVFTVTATDLAGNTATVTHTYTVTPPPRPDALIRRGPTGVYVGDGVYNTTGQGQTRNAAAHLGGSVTYFVALQNDATVPDEIRVRGMSSTNGFNIRYYTNGTGITHDVTRGTYTTATLAPGASVTLKIEVTVATNVPVGAQLSGVLTAKSGADRTVRDVVKFVTHRV